MTSLDLALIGNSSVAALVDANGTIVWSCLPRFEQRRGVLRPTARRRGADDYGFFEVELTDFARAEQAYIAHTPILKTRLFDRHGGGVEITDLAPRFEQFGRLFLPRDADAPGDRGTARAVLARGRSACDTRAARNRAAPGASASRGKRACRTARIAGRDR